MLNSWVIRVLAALCINLLIIQTSVALTFSPTILNGTETSLEKLPFQVKIYTYFNKGDYTYTYLCGGTIIDDDTVLTAAHCVDKSSDSYDFQGVKVVYLDYTNSVQKSVLVTPTYIKSSSSWTGSLTNSNDYAAIYSSGTFANSKKIKIASTAEMTAMYNQFSNSYVANQDNEGNVQASGYGEDEEGNSDDELNRVLMAGIPASTCLGIKVSGSIYSGSYPSSNDYICATTTDESINYGTCSGDSGGPLIWKDPDHSSDADYGVRLVGISSYVSTDTGDNCNFTDDDDHAGFTNINFFKDDINSDIGDLKGDSSYDFSSLSLTYSFDSDPMLSANKYDSDDEDDSNSGGGSMGSWLLILLPLALLRRRRI
ncbi:S1 family peptidase [Vibrio nitrifigilis]|uniref:Trypsin-like serine protease n=1 Tax=Vibrio nitrifigilis TaxID=2789781 RepID=A0ABS0GL15_9VIBR|nr:trypsin-like serine protease [Vibrio nitrifigilis]MBF9003027.1 trypsin-like serine protease [Vibrio nitrifigilis]